ncbi:MAG TPA: FHA domain-containing protein, partial [Kofleriaceae bacterium]|nr:FHA domain-containing protein [Kofleriaceae bacterium]
MSTSCPVCGAPPERGVLCAACAGRIPTCESLIPAHVSARSGDRPTAWLIDCFGSPHGLAPGRSMVGRRPPADLLVLNASVSREHAELSVDDDGKGWQVRDLGSRNGTFIDGQRVKARAALIDRAVVRFGDVGFLFLLGPLAMPSVGLRSLATAHAADSGAFRITLVGPERELCLVGERGGTDREAAMGGALLHRAPGAGDWYEVSLPPVEFQLLRVLCTRAVDEADSPSRARGCVPTRQLARDLPFQSRYANEENVRQAVRRLRATLSEIGAADLIEAQPGRGY